MPRLEYSARFAADLAAIRTQKLEHQILSALDSIEDFPEIGSRNIPDSIAEQFGPGVRKLPVNPFDLIYTYYPEDGLVRIEALVHQRAAW